MTIDDYANIHGTDKGSRFRHHQISGQLLPETVRRAGGVLLPDGMVHAKTYDKYITGLRDKPITLLELGIGCGASLKMWYDAFPFATIYGWGGDNHGDFQNERIKTFTFLQQDRKGTTELARSLARGCDVIVDDCSHNGAWQQLSLAILFPFLALDGYYFIEDVDVSPDTVCLAQKYIETGVFKSPSATDAENTYIQRTATCEFAGINNILFRKVREC